MLFEHCLILRFNSNHNHSKPPEIGANVSQCKDNDLEIRLTQTVFGISLVHPYF